MESVGSRPNKGQQQDPRQAGVQQPLAAWPRRAPQMAPCRQAGASASRWRSGPGPIRRRHRRRCARTQRAGDRLVAGGVQQRGQAEARPQQAAGGGAAQDEAHQHKEGLPGGD